MTPARRDAFSQLADLVVEDPVIREIVAASPSVFLSEERQEKDLLKMLPRARLLLKNPDSNIHDLWSDLLKHKQSDPDVVLEFLQSHHDQLKFSLKYVL